MESRERETDEGEDRESLLARSSTTVKEKEGEEGSTLPDLFLFFPAVVVVKNTFYIQYLFLEWHFFFLPRLMDLHH